MTMLKKFKDQASGSVAADILRHQQSGQVALPTARPEMRQHDVPLEQLVPNPSQPRRVFDLEEIKSLAESIEARGQLQPIVVKPQSDGTFMVIAGERRWRAAQHLGRATIRAVWSLNADPAIDALLENCQRANLLPIELADALAGLVEATQMTGREAARLMGYREDEASRLLKIASLPDLIRDEALGPDGKGVSMAALYEVAMCEKGSVRQALVWDQAKEGASIADLRALRAKADEEGEPARREPRAVDPAKVVSAAQRSVQRVAKVVHSLKESGQALDNEQRSALEELRAELDRILDEGDAL